MRSLILSNLKMCRLIWKRRRNLEGHEFDVVVDNWMPFANIECDKKEDGYAIVKSASGFCIDVINDLRKSLNFSVKLLCNKKRHSWNHMVELVHNKSVDFAGTGFTHISHRRELVDFSVPFVPSKWAMFYARNSNQEHFNWKLYFYSFRIESWIGYSLFVTFTAIVFSTMVFWSQNLNMSEDNSNTFSVMTSFVFTALSYVSTKINTLQK